MKLTEGKLKGIIREEVESNEDLIDAIERLIDKMEDLDTSMDYVASAMTGEDPLSIALGQKSIGRSYRSYARRDKDLEEQMLAEKMPESWGRAAKLLGLGAALAGATWGGGEYASHAQEKAQEGDAFRSAMQVSAEKVKGLKSFMDIAQLPDAAGAPVGEPVGDTKQAMEDFQFDHLGKWSNAGDVIAGGFGLPQETFGYVPADQIGDNEVLPFVGMTKADYETLLRAFYLDDPGGKGDQRLEDLVMGGKPGSSMYWAYGGGGEPLFSFFDAGADSGDRGMMLPPEWSVAYDLLQTRQAKAAGDEVSAQQQDLSIPLNQTSWNEWKKMIKKELAKLL